MRPYPAYKASGVDWIGEVPEGWGLVKLRYLAHFESGGTPNRDKPEFWNGDIPWVSPKDMKVRRIRTSEEQITEEGLLGSGSALTKAGAVLIVVRSGILKHTIPVAINEVPVAINQDIKAVTFPSGLVSPDYFANFVDGHNDALVLAWGKQGATVESIEQQYVSETRIPLPPLPEQREIAAFLDREVGKIDALVEESRQLIALLAEKRQATISHAVTRGLNPAARLRPSGIDWLGDIPEGWEVVPLKFLGEFSAGAGFPNDEQGVGDEEIPFFKVNALGRADANGVLVCDGVDTISKETAMRLRAKIFPAETIVFAKIGAALLLGRIRSLPCPACLDNNMMGFIVSSNHSRKFLQYVMSLMRFDLISNPGTVPSLNEGQISNQIIAVPPRSEQRLIAEAIDAATARLDALTAEANSAISLLLERRAALISAAVTGKIDVRGAAPAPAQERT